jgi:LysR family transcriptional regulator for metE and metH
MDMDLDSRHLRLVSEIARAGNVTRAADRLHVTQSAVSHQLRDIEDRLGTPLFVRAGRRMFPTAAGAHLVQTAGRVLDEIARAEATVHQFARNETGEFRVCTECHTGYHWLPPVLETVYRRFPGHQVRIAAEHTLHPIAGLLEGKLDLAIVNRQPVDRRLRIRPLFEDEHAAIVHPAHPFASRPFVTPEQLAAERLFLYSRTLDDSFIVRRVMRPAGIEPTSVTFLQLTEAMLEMIKARMGVSVLPVWSIVPALESGAVKAVRITRGGVFRRWEAATLAAAPPSDFVEHFIAVVLEHARTLGRLLGPSPGTALTPSTRRTVVRGALASRVSAPPSAQRRQGSRPPSPASTRRSAGR